MTIRNQAFLQSIGCTEGEVADARFKGTQTTTSMAAALLGGAKPKAKPVRKSWDDCQALAKILGVTFGHKAIVFADGYSFENGKMYGYGNNNSSVHEALLQLQSDRLAAKSDDAIATEAAEAHAMIEEVAPAVILEVAPECRHFYERPLEGGGIEVYCGDARYGYALAESIDCDDEWLDTESYLDRMNAMWDREDRQADKAANFEMSINK